LCIIYTEMKIESENEKSVDVSENENENENENEKSVDVSENENENENNLTVPYQQSNGFQNSINMTSLDNLLEKERQYNKNEPWNKLDKTCKTQILHIFSETYGREKKIPIKDIKQLKLFFNTCLEKGKLSKAKEVVYNRETREIESIPSLFFNVDKKQYTLRNIETKRVSTLKSMTPTRKISTNESN